MKKWNFSKKFTPFFISTVLITMVSCQGGGGDSTSEVISGGDEIPTQPAPISTTGFSLPEELEIIPIEQNRGVQQLSLMSAGPGMAVRALPGSDFETDQTYIRINEPVLERFNIIDELLSALRQTKYEDPRNLNQGPYATLIRFDEDEGGQLEKWIVDSAMIIEDGREVNRLNVWIDGEEEQIKAQFKIFEPVSAANPNGVWSVHALIDNDSRGFLGEFTAVVDTAANGEGRIRLKMKGLGENETDETLGKLFVSENQGRGMITYPEYLWDEENDTNIVEQRTAKYGFNDDFLITERNSSLTCKDRSKSHDLFMNYNVYDADGRNLRNENDWSFSVRLPGAEGESEKYYWYGAWNGRHQLHSNSGNIDLDIGDIVYLSEHNQQAKEFYFGGSYRGHLVRHKESSATIDQLKGYLLQGSEGEHFSILWDEEDQVFYRCQGYNCGILSSDAFDFSEYASVPELKRDARFGSNDQELQLNEAKTGFVDHEPLDQQVYWVSVYQPMFVEFDGTSWKKFEYTFPHPDRWDYRLGESSAFNLNANQDYHFRAHEIEFKLRYRPEAEIEYVISRKEEEVILPGDDSYDLEQVIMIDDGAQNIYRFDPVSLMLTNALTDEIIENDVHQVQGIDGHKYSWRYDNGNEEWARVSYLLDDQGEFYLLDKPVFLESVVVNGKATGTLRYDGHFNGLPDYWRMLQNSGGDLSQEILDSKINLPHTQTYSDFLDPENTHYHVKASRGYRLFEVVDTEDCTVGIDQNVDLSDMPAFVNPEIGDQPDVRRVTVIEGNFL